MVKMIPDNTGRFAKRPFFTEKEIDGDCERLIRELLLKRHGNVEYPVLTDDLTVLIENHDAELDCYADLRAYGDDVEGVTEFFPEKGPKVSISEHISGDDRRENRYRTTLTHEFGHVKFHGPLWAEKFATGDLLDRRPHANKAVSKRDNILNAPQSDWMEWQAGYISGALLMPVTPVRRLVSDYCSPRELHGCVFRNIRPPIPITSGQVELPQPTILPGMNTAPSPPPADKIAIYARNRAGAPWVDVMRPSGRDFPLQPHFGVNRIANWSPSVSTTITTEGLPVTSVGTVATPTLAATNLAASMRRWRVTSGATVDVAAEQRSAGWACWRGNAAGLGGWTVVTRISLTTLQATGMGFFGLYGSTSAQATNLSRRPADRDALAERLRDGQF